MEITERNNFCRVFELPESYPEGFCFGGGKLVQFKMVDWFYPIPSGDIIFKQIKTWEEYELEMKPFLQDKVYVKPGRKYILITKFDKCFLFEGKL